MNYYTVTVRSSKAAVDEIERRLCAYDPAEFSKGDCRKRIDEETVEFNPPFLDVPDDRIAEVSRRYPGKISPHYFASIGCSYHTVDKVLRDGNTETVPDEHDTICD